MSLTREQIAVRLRDARDTIGLTQAQVAASLGVHRPTISELEAGRRGVTAEELYKLSELYCVPVSELLSESPATAEVVAERLMLRSFEANSPGVNRALQRFVADRKAEFELEELLAIPHPVPSAIRREAPTPRDKWHAVQQGEAIADLERRQLDLGSGPIPSVLRLLAMQGVRIAPLSDVDNGSIDGVYLESADLGPCVGINQRDGDWTGGRAAFTAAHEYAHVILRDRQQELFALQSGTRDPLEVRANAFAAAFLMPREGIREYFESKGMLRGGTLTHLAPADVVRAMDYFGVSRTALLFRLLNLEMISSRLADILTSFTVSEVASAAGVMFRDRQYRGTRLPELAIHSWRSGLISAGRAADLCHMDLQEFRSLMTTLGEEPSSDEAAPLLGAAGV